MRGRNSSLARPTNLRMDRYVHTSLRRGSPRASCCVHARVVWSPRASRCDAVFASLDRRPVASGSIAQVHKGTLRRAACGPNAEAEPVRVAVKVRRRGRRSRLGSSDPHPRGGVPRTSRCSTTLTVGAAPQRRAAPRPRRPSHGRPRARRRRRRAVAAALGDGRAVLGDARRADAARRRGGPPAPLQRQLPRLARRLVSRAALRDGRGPRRDVRARQARCLARGEARPGLAPRRRVPRQPRRGRLPQDAPRRQADARRPASRQPALRRSALGQRGARRRGHGRTPRRARDRGVYRARRGARRGRRAGGGALRSALLAGECGDAARGRRGL
mmetsp:Transcript_25312/g.100884  ORF Transcript_25312/g.100884 Transcript_25312/m.100884 type:complete len:330 (-) Transcript_25312:523-1512(-)